MIVAILDPILHAVIALCLLAAYCTLWALGHQDTTLLALLGGQLSALGVTQVASRVQESVAAVKAGEQSSPAPAAKPRPPADDE